MGTLHATMGTLHATMGTLQSIFRKVMHKLSTIFLSVTNQALRMPSFAHWRISKAVRGQHACRFWAVWIIFNNSFNLS